MARPIKTNFSTPDISLTRFSRGVGNGLAVQVTVKGLDGGASALGTSSYISLSREEAGELAEELLRFAHGNEEVTY